MPIIGKNDATPTTAPPDNTSIYQGGDEGAVYFSTNSTNLFELFGNISGYYFYPGIKHGKDLYIDYESDTAYNTYNPIITKGDFTIGGKNYYTMKSPKELSVPNLSGNFNYNPIFVTKSADFSGILQEDGIIEITDLYNRLPYNFDGSIPIINPGEYFYENEYFEINPSGDFTIVYDEDDSETFLIEQDSQKINLYDYVNNSFYFGPALTTGIPKNINIYTNSPYIIYNTYSLTFNVEITGEFGTLIHEPYYIYATLPDGTAVADLSLLYDIGTTGTNSTKVLDDAYTKDSPFEVITANKTTMKTIKLIYNSTTPVSSFIIYYSEDNVSWKNFTVDVSNYVEVNTDIANFDIDPLGYYSGLSALGFNLHIDSEWNLGNLSGSILNSTYDITDQNDNKLFNFIDEELSLSGFYTTNGYPDLVGNYYTFYQAYRRPPVPYTEIVSGDEYDLTYIDSTDLSGNYWYDIDKDTPIASTGVWALADMYDVSDILPVKEAVLQILLTNRDFLYLDRMGTPYYYTGTAYEIPTDYDTTSYDITATTSPAGTPNLLTNKDGNNVLLYNLYLKFISLTNNPNEDTNGYIT